MGCFAPDKPGNLNYGKILGQTLQTQIGLQPLLQEAEGQWDPANINQSLNNMNSLLFGSEGGSYDVQTFRPTVSQTGNALNYGPVPKGFMGEVDRPQLGTARNPGPAFGAGSDASGMTFDANTGLPVPSIYRSHSSIGSDAAMGAGAGAILGPVGSAAGALIGSGIGSIMETGNPDPVSAAMGLDFFGAPTKRLAGPAYGTRTVTQNAQPGLVDIMARLNSATRAANVNDLSTMGPGALEALKASNPDMAALMDRLNSQANDELTAGSGLTPDEQRLMQQATRASWAARGLDGTNASASDEVLRQYALGQQLLRQRQQFAQGVVGQDQQAYQDPILALLTQSGNGTSAQAQGMMPGNLFNPESPFAGNIASANQQMAALFADPSTLSKINQVGSTVSNTIGSVASIAGGVAGI
jgi:hypothetical protein